MSILRKKSKKKLKKRKMLPLLKLFMKKWRMQERSKKQKILNWPRLSLTKKKRPEKLLKSV